MTHQDHIQDLNETSTKIYAKCRSCGYIQTAVNTDKTTFIQELEETALCCDYPVYQIEEERELVEKKQVKEMVENLLEPLSDLEHKQWMHWTKWLVNESGYDLPDDLVAKWKENWEDYSELPEDAKDKDRKWARKIINLIGGDLDVQ